MLKARKKGNREKRKWKKLKESVRGKVAVAGVW
jgi:hypothetical protein